MGKYKYTESEQKRNNVLNYQSKELEQLRERADKDRNRRECEIAELEMKCRDLGIDPNSVGKTVKTEVPKRAIFLRNIRI